MLTIHDYGEIDGVLFVDMRWIDGTPLREVLVRYGPLAPARAAAIIRQVASALDAAHERSVMHSDVRPENILITHDEFAYLMDLGIANAAADQKLAATPASTADGSGGRAAPVGDEASPPAPSQFMDFSRHGRRGHRRSSGRPQCMGGRDAFSRADTAPASASRSTLSATRLPPSTATRTPCLADLTSPAIRCFPTRRRSTGASKPR